MMRTIFHSVLAAFGVLIGAGALTPPAFAAGDVDQGAKAFRICAACHSLGADVNMTGPSLAGIWGREAGSLKSFDRYSPALKSSGLVWDEKTLDAWLKSPAAVVPGNSMSFAGVPDVIKRADLIAFLKAESSGQVQVPAALTTPPFDDLKKLGSEHQIVAISYCRDTYRVTTADGRTAEFWEANLRFKTDSSDTGPHRGKPVMLPAGMMGDRASVFFSSPGEISEFIKQQCEAKGD